MIHTINTTIKEQVQVQENIQHLHQDMQQVINGTITKDETIAMIAQHYLTLPVFNTIYQNHDFVQHNPISQVLTKAISQFDNKLHQLQQQDHS